jgi:hypothetical protein
MMSQPVNVEERNQHGLDVGLHLLRSSVEEMMMCSTGRTYRFGLDHGGQCKLTRDCPSVPPLGDGAQISLPHISFANLQLEFSDTYRMLF